MNKLDLSIVIVSYNTKKDLQNCLDSLTLLKIKKSYELIIVDNGSTDESTTYIKNIAKANKKIIPILNSDNSGFAAANNQGIKKSRGKYILLLNSDTLIEEDIFTPIIDWMDEHPKVGISGCALLNKDRSVQGSGGFFPNLPRAISWLLFLDDIPFISKYIKPFHPLHTKSFFKNEAFYSQPHEQDWVTGAFFLIKREVVDKIGYIDEEYFMYTEEVDYCYRAKQKGWKIWYLPQWSIVHFGQGSGSPTFAIISEWRNIQLFYKKHYSLLSLFILKIFLLVGAILRIIIFGIIEGPRTAKIYINALKTL